MIYRVTDGNDNDFFVNDKSLAIKIIMENDNPFIHYEELDNRLTVKKEHLIKSYSDFCVYFY